MVDGEFCIKVVYNQNRSNNCKSKSPGILKPFQDKKKCPAISRKKLLNAFVKLSWVIVEKIPKENTHTTVIDETFT